jgi:hypothetical protein
MTALKISYVGFKLTRAMLMVRGFKQSVWARFLGGTLGWGRRWEVELDLRRGKPESIACIATQRFIDSAARGKLLLAIPTVTLGYVCRKFHV